MWSAKTDWTLRMCKLIWVFAARISLIVVFFSCAVRLIYKLVLWLTIWSPSFWIGLFHLWTRKCFFRKNTNALPPPPRPTPPPPPNPARVVILVRNTPSRPVLHLYQASSKYSVGYSCYKTETRNQIQTQEGKITPKEKQSCHSCMWHIVWSCSLLLISIIKIFQRVFDIYSGHKSSCNSCKEHFVWSYSTVLPGTIKIFWRVFQLQSRREIYFK